MQYLIYIIPVAVVAIIFVAGFAYSRKMAAKYKNTSGTDANDPAQVLTATLPKPDVPKIYEKPGVVQQSDHPLGAVQSVIRGRVRFIWFGLVLIGVALFGLYAVYIGDLGADIMESFGGRTTLNVLIVTVLLAGCLIWGLRLISYITYRVKLRHTGFEISSVFGTKAYEYKDVDFYLQQTLEHKYDSEGYRPVIMKTQTFNWIWVCQVLFRDGRKPIMLKSSRYAWLKNKIIDLQAAIDGGS